MQPVVFCAVQPVAVVSLEALDLELATGGKRKVHCLGWPCAEVEIVQALGELTVEFGFVLRSLFGVKNKRVLPMLAGIGPCALQSWIETGRLRHGVTDPCTLFEDSRLTGVRCERLALLDAERLEHGDEEAVAFLHRVVVDDVRQQLPVREALRFNRIDVLARGWNYPVGLGIVALAIRIDACFLEEFGCSGDVAVYHKTAKEEHVYVHLRVHDEIPFGAPIS